MSTKFLSPGWRMPRNANQSKSANYSINFSGSQQIDSTSNLGISGASPRTFSAWMKTTDAGGGWDVIVATGNTSNTSNNFELDYRSSVIIWERWGLSVMGSVTVNDGNWHHACITYDGNILKLYVDGSEDTGGDFPYTIGATTSTDTPVRIGGMNHGSKYFNGQIDEVAIFDYALSASQVTTLWGGGTSVSNPMALPNPPKVYYPLGTSAWNGNFLAENNAIGDYVFDFDGSDNIEIDSIGSTISTMTQISVSAWVKTSSSSFGYILFAGRGGSGRTGYVGFATRPTVYAVVGGQPNVSGFSELTTTATVNDDNWHHLVMTFNNSNGVIQVYIDGSLDPTSSSTSGLIPTNIIYANIGQRAYNNDFRFNGETSNIQIWNSILETSDVETLYNYGSPIRTLANIPQNSNLKAWYKLDASEIYDSSNTQWQIANNVLSDKAYSFDGTNNIEITQNSSIQTSNFSIGLWIKGYPQLDKTIIENGGANGFSIKTKHNDATKVLINTGGINGLELTGALNGEWNFVYFTMSGSISRGGVNGGYSNAGGAARNYDSSKGLFIGSKSDSTSGFTGEIAQVVYYDEKGPNNAGSLYGNLPANPPPAYPNKISNPFSGSGSADPNLVSWWKLDAASITDSQGSNNGTNNGATLIDTNVGRPAGIGGLSSGMSQANLVQSDLQTVAPYSKYAMSFDGTNDDIDLNSDITLTGNKSVSFWVNFTSTIYGVVFGGASNNYYPFIDSTNISIRNGGTTSSFAHGGLTAGVWYHICITGDGTNATAYLNGSSLGTQTDRGFTFKLINGEHTGIYGIDGKLSNCAIWNTVLTSSEVREIYNEGLPSNLNTFSGTAPVSWWQLGENSSYVSGWVFADEMPAGNNGTGYGVAETDLTNGVGTTANGTSSGMAVGALVGDAPYSTANAISNGMAVTAKGINVP
jgi:hypothetical protein